MQENNIQSEHKNSEGPFEVTGSLCKGIKNVFALPVHINQDNC